jgi:O-antigen/teichoic acid export membrane protein
MAALMALLVIVAVPVGAVQTAVTQASCGAPRASAAWSIERASRIGLFLLAAGVVATIPLNQALALRDGWAVALVAAWAAVACIGAVAKGSLLGRLEYAPVAGALVAAAGVRVVLGLALLRVLHVEGAMLATLIGEAVAAAIVLMAMRRTNLLSVSTPSFEPRSTDAVIALAAQLGLWVLAGVTTVLGRRVLPLSEAGNFAAASTLTNAAVVLPLAVATAYFPAFAREGSMTRLVRAMGLALGLGITAAALLIGAPSVAIHALAGGSYQAEPLVVSLLALQSALVGVCGVAVLFLLARRRPAALTVWVGAGGAAILSLFAHDAVQLAVVAFAAAVVATSLAVRSAVRAARSGSALRRRDFEFPAVDRLVSIVVPSYNSGPALRPTVLSLCRALDVTGWRYEVLVEIDGSTDRSDDTMHDLPPDVVVECSLVNEGKGAALRRGFARARGEYVGFIDGDGDIDVDVVPQLVWACRRPETWAAVASKHAPGARVEMSSARSAFSRAYRILVRMLFGLEVSDTQCGAKVFSRRGLEEVLPWAHERGFAFDVELLGLGRRLGVGAVEELPVQLRRNGGHTTVSAGRALRTLTETIRVWSRVVDAPVTVTVAQTGVTLAPIELADAGAGVGVG